MSKPSTQNNTLHSSDWHNCEWPTAFDVARGGVKAATLALRHVLHIVPRAHAARASRVGFDETRPAPATRHPHPRTRAEDYNFTPPKFFSTLKFGSKILVLRSEANFSVFLRYIYFLATALCYFRFSHFRSAFAVRPELSGTPDEVRSDRSWNAFRGSPFGTFRNSRYGLSPSHGRHGVVAAQKTHFCVRHFDGGLRVCRSVAEEHVA